MIIQDILGEGEDSGERMVITTEFLTKINCLIVLMGVIFTLLCLLLTVCVIMLVYIYIQRRRDPSGQKCCHHSSSNSENFLNISTLSSSQHHHQHRYSSQPKTVWTVPIHQTDPIYEDIIEVKRKIDSKPSRDDAKEVVTDCQGSKMKQSPSSSSSVMYGVITAKEVARFVPCNNVDIGRWRW